MFYSSVSRFVWKIAKLIKSSKSGGETSLRGAGSADASDAVGDGVTVIIGSVAGGVVRKKCTVAELGVCVTSISWINVVMLLA